MSYFGKWFGEPETTWWDANEVAPAPSGGGGSSNKKVLGVKSPRPAAPLWRQIAGAAGATFNETRRFIHDMLGRDHLWGNHVEVTFSAATTPTRIDTGLGGPSHGYKIVRSDSNITVWDASPGTPPDPRTDRGVIWLQASGTGKVTLYIY